MALYRSLFYLKVSSNLFIFNLTIDLRIPCGIMTIFYCITDLFIANTGDGFTLSSLLSDLLPFRLPFISVSNGSSG